MPSLAAARGHDRAVGSTAAPTATPTRSTTSATAAIASHFVGGCPVRTSSTRSLGAFANVFAIESFMDELAHAAGVAPDEFRIAHLGDPRAIEVIEAAVDLAGGLVAPGGVDAPGRGLAFARYENVKAYVAVVAEVDRRSPHRRITPQPARGSRPTPARSSIPAVSPTSSRAGSCRRRAGPCSRSSLVDGGRVTATDWEDYPILRFSDVPPIETRLLHRPEEPVLGAAEAVTGPTPAAIANAVFQATGARLRRLPLRPDRVVAALDELEQPTAVLAPHGWSAYWANASESLQRL